MGLDRAGARNLCPARHTIGVILQFYCNIYIYILHIGLYWGSIGIM